MEEFKREQRYVVVKISDINAAGCTQEERDAFNVLCDKVALYRARAGKRPLECVVVESDWPEYEPTWEAIQRRMEGKFPVALLAIGAPMAGGFFAGEMMIDGELHALIVAPKTEGEKMNLEYKLNDRGTADGTDSDDDGLANTGRINDDNHPAAQFCRSLNIGGHDDWYLPSRDELMRIWMALGPNLQKTPELFRPGGAEAFEDRWYWSSTEHASFSTYAWYVDFYVGGQNTSNKSDVFRVRAVRRLKI